MFFDAGRRLMRIYAAQHGEGAFYYPPGTPDKNVWTEVNGRPVLYSSLNGHAIYNSAGVHPTPGKGTKLDGKWSLGLIGVRLQGTAGLVNLCADGGDTLDCSQRYQLVASDFRSAPVEEPSWLQFLGRYGYVDPPLHDVTKKFNHNLAKQIEAILDPLLPSFLQNLAHPLVEKIVDFIGPPIEGMIADQVDSFDGVKMPKAKSDWTTL